MCGSIVETDRPNLPETRNAADNHLAGHARQIRAEGIGGLIAADVRQMLR